MHAHIHDVPDAAITEDLSGVSPKCRLVAGRFREHEPLVTTHAYEAGEFEVVVSARVVGEAYGAFFTWAA